MFDLILQTNGDILSIFLFLGLIIYFIRIEQKTNIEHGFLIACIIGFIVNTIVVADVLQKQQTYPKDK